MAKNITQYRWTKARKNRAHFVFTLPVCLCPTLILVQKTNRLAELDNLLEKAVLRQTLENQLIEAKELAGGSDD